MASVLMVQARVHDVWTAQQDTKYRCTMGWLQQQQQQQNNEDDDDEDDDDDIDDDDRIANHKHKIK